MRRGRLNWPEGCMSVKSMQAVLEVPRLKVWRAIHVLCTFIPILEFDIGFLMRYHTLVLILFLTESGEGECRPLC